MKMETRVNQLYSYLCYFSEEYICNKNFVLAYHTEIHIVELIKAYLIYVAGGIALVGAAHFFTRSKTTTISQCLVCGNMSTGAA